jgi:hypothetical protein
MTTTAKNKSRAPKSTSPKAKSPTTARRKAAVVVAAEPVVENRRSGERTGFVDLLAEALIQAHGFDRRAAR